MKTAAPVPIVLAPGYMLDDDLWREFKLQFEGHAIFYADLTQDDTIAGMAARLIQDAPAQFLLIGFSMGGYVAGRSLAKHPNASWRSFWSLRLPTATTPSSASGRRLSRGTTTPPSSQD